MLLLFLLTRSVSNITADGDVSQNAEVDLPCNLTELDLGADEVFVVLSAASPSRLPFTRNAVRTERNVPIQTVISGIFPVVDTIQLILAQFLN